MARRTDRTNHFLAIRRSREWRTRHALSIKIVLVVGSRASLPICVALSSEQVAMNVSKSSKNPDLTGPDELAWTGNEPSFCSRTPLQLHGQVTSHILAVWHHGPCMDRSRGSLFGNLSQQRRKARTPCSGFLLVSGCNQNRTGQITLDKSHYHIEFVVLAIVGQTFDDSIHLLRYSTYGMFSVHVQLRKVQAVSTVIAN